MTATVRCYRCRKQTPPDAQSCAQCETRQFVLCGCGSSHSIYVTSCPECGAEYVPRRPPKRWEKVVGVLIVLVVLAGVGAGAVFFMRDDPQQARRRAHQQAADELAAERFEEARVRLLASLEQHGTNTRTLHLLAFAEQAVGNHGEAERRAREILDRNPDHREATVLLVQSLVAQGLDSEAIEIARARIEAGRDDATLHHCLATALVRSKEGTPEEIETHLREAAARTEELGPVHLQLGEWILIRAEAFPDAELSPDSEAHLRDARRVLGHRLDDDEPDPSTYRLAARMDLLLGDTSRLDELTEAVRSGVADTSLRLLLARIAAKSGDAARAFHLIGDRTEETASAEELAAMHQVLVSLRDDERAARVVARGLERFPDDPEIALIAAQAALARGDTEEAAARLRPALGAAPDDPRLTALLAETLVSDDQRKEAEALLRDGMRSRDHPFLRLRLALLILTSAALPEARLAEAERLLESSEDAERTGPQAAALVRSVRARIALERGRPAAALRALRQTGPDVLADPVIPTLRARAYREVGANTRAHEEMTRAIELAGRRPALLVRRGRDALACGDATAAMLDARAALDADAGLTAARLLLARALLARGSAREALAEIDRLPAGARDGEAAVVRAQALAASGDAAAATAVLAEATREARTPDEALAAGLSFARSRDAEAGGGTARVRTFLEEFVSAHPDHRGAAMLLGNRLRLDGDIDEARGVLDTALESHPADASLLLARWETASAAREGELAAEPDVAETVAAQLADVAEGSWQELLVRGRSALRDGDVESALDALRRAADAGPGRAKTHAFHAVAAHRAGDLREARAAAERALSMDGDLDISRRALSAIVLDEGRAAFERKASDETLAALSELIGLGIDDHQGGLALAAWQAGRWGGRNLLLRARADCEKLLASTPQDESEERARVWFALGNIARDLGDAAGFRTAAERHVAIAPDDPVAHARHAIALAGAGLDDAALAALDAAREPLRDDPALVLAHIQVLGSSGRLEDAERQARAWAERDATSVTARVLLGRSLAQQRKVQPAETAFREALALDPASAPAIRGVVGMLAARNAIDEAIRFVADAREGLASEVRAGLALMEANLRFRQDPASPEAFLLVSQLADDEEVPAFVRCAATVRTLDRLIREKRRAAGARVAERAFTWVLREPACGPGGALARRAANVLVSAGIATEHAGARSESRRFYREALARNPQSVVALNNLAEQFAESRNTADQAVEYARRALDDAPEVPEYWDSLGTAHLANEEPTEAVRAYERAIELYEARDGAEGKTLTGLSDETNVRHSKLRLARARAESER